MFFLYAHKSDFFGYNYFVIHNACKKRLESLKAEKLRIERWHESEQVSSQLKVMIFNTLEYLLPEPYPYDELADMSLVVYQHVYSHYQCWQFFSSYSVILDLILGQAMLGNFFKAIDDAVPFDSGPRHPIYRKGFNRLVKALFLCLK